MRGRMTYRTKKQRRQIILFSFGIIVLVVLIFTGFCTYRNWNTVSGWLVTMWSQMTNEKEQGLIEDNVPELSGEIRLSTNDVNVDNMQEDTLQVKAENPESKKQREIQIEAVTLNKRLVTGDYVDIRIRYQNGEEYILLHGKQIIIDTANPEEKALYLSMQEEEMLYYSSALYDITTYPESRIYPVKHQITVQDTNEKDKPVNYIPHTDVILMMMENGIITEKRKSDLVAKREKIEQRLQIHMKENAPLQQENNNETLTNEIEGVWIYE